MARTPEQAIAQISRLPDADQEKIGRKPLSHVEKLDALVVNSLDADIEDFLHEKNSRRGGA
jgi:hypothetical protein